MISFYFQFSRYAHIKKIKKNGKWKKSLYLWYNKVVFERFEFSNFLVDVAVCILLVWLRPWRTSRAVGAMPVVSCLLDLNWSRYVSDNRVLSFRDSLRSNVTIYISLSMNYFIIRCILRTSDISYNLCQGGDVCSIGV